MTEITDIPEVQLRIERAGVYRAMFVNPNEGATEVPATGEQVINTLRVYHTVHPSVAVTQVVDISLPFVLSNQPTELTFEPPNMGVFAFSWAYVVAATPTPIDEEGEISGVAEYVYGRSSIIMRTANVQKCFTTPLTQADVLRINSFASRQFDEFTGWFFFPKFINMRLGGKDSFDLRVPLPIIQIDELRRLHHHHRTSQSTLVDPDVYVVYNRHMEARNAYDPAVSTTRPDGFLNQPGDGTGGMFGPEDDRRNPLISFIFANEYARGNLHVRSGGVMMNHRFHHLHGGHGHSRGYQHALGFTRGRQSILAKGFFGFTEGDLSVPVGVCVAAERLALRQAVLEMGDEDDVERTLRGHKVIMEKTDVHLIQYESKDRLTGFFTGEPIIDQWIAAYSRTIGGGFV